MNARQRPSRSRQLASETLAATTGYSFHVSSPERFARIFDEVNHKYYALHSTKSTQERGVLGDYPRSGRCWKDRMYHNHLGLYEELNPTRTIDIVGENKDLVQ